MVLLRSIQVQVRATVIDVGFLMEEENGMRGWGTDGRELAW